MLAEQSAALYLSFRCWDTGTVLIRVALQHAQLLIMNAIEHTYILLG